MARPPATPQQRRAARSAIRRAAADVAIEEGVSGVTVRKVAARAGVSIGTVYTHFPSLHDLMRSLWAEPLNKINERMTAVAADHDDPFDRIRALLEAYVAFAFENEALFRGALLYVRPATTPVPEPRPLDEVAFARLLVVAVAEAQQRGEAREGDPEQLGEVLWAGVHGALALPINTDAYALRPARSQAELMITMLLEALQR
ncbi:MAG: TetR/AcrR family transcriptional regulator [Ilumatobacteraceae bacterium]